MMLEKLEQGKQQMIHAMGAKDAKAYGAVFSEQGTIFMDRAQIVQGRDSIVAQMKNLMDLLGPLTLLFEMKDRWVSENEIVESGLFRHFYPETGDAFYSGQYLAIWRWDGNTFQLEKYFSFES